jgi:hypothetical protein
VTTPDPAVQENREIAEQDKPVDMIWILRGGATDVYTLISNLSALQERLPNHHLSETTPYILADSAGAYPAAGLVSPNPISPLELPALFRRNIAQYLSPNRKEAEQALIEDVGDIRVRESALPVTISTVEITTDLHAEYFTNFPNSYAEARPGFKAPPNKNGDTPLSKAVLASSAFALMLGDCKIDNRRFMDMAFLETHSSNLIEYYLAHAKTNPGRRLVCVIFGNNYVDLKLGIDEQLNVRGLNRHFGNAVRARVQNDLINTATTLFGKENVFDLSLYIQQPFQGPNAGPASNAFRRDELAIRERIAWTDKYLKGSVSHSQTLDRLAEVIKRGVIPQASIAPSSHAPAPMKAHGAPLVPLTGKEKLISQVREFAPAAAFMAVMAGEALSPVVERTKPVLHAGASLAEAGAKKAGVWFGQQWAETASPWLEKQKNSLVAKLLPNDRVATTMPPSQPHLSEPHMPSESGRMPL